MSDNAPLRQKLLTLYEELPSQLRAAAHWVIEHSNEVALLSMRDQARRAGVPPTTMTRLAQRLGFEGYDEVRALYAERLLRAPGGFSGKADELLQRRRVEGEDVLSADLIETAATQASALARPEHLLQISDAARLMIAARRSFVIGQRAGYSVAYQLAYICSLAGYDAQLLDRPGGIGLDALRDADSGDVLVAVSINPYTRATVDIAAYAARRGMKVIAITDSPISPLGRSADVKIIVGVETQSFFHTMSAAFIAAETIAALVTSAIGEKAGKALARSEDQFEALNTYILSRPVRFTAKKARRRAIPRGGNGAS